MAEKHFAGGNEKERQVMLLSVVVPTMNKAALLAQTLSALEAQDPGRPGDWEVVVVNDGSTDGTAEYLGSLDTWLRPRLQVVAPPQNVGRAAARNLGAKAAAGRFLLFMDDDIVAPPGLVAAHLDILLAQPGCGTIGYAVTAPDLVDAPHFHYLDSRGAARLPMGPAPGRFFVTQNAAVPRDAFLAVGGFDEGFAGYGFEDMEVAFRLEEAGVQFQTLVSPVPCHVHHHTLAEYFAKKVECGQESLRRLAEKHPHRLREMHLHHVVAAPGADLPGGKSWLIRRVTDSMVGARLPQWLGGWPTGAGQRPVWPGVYFRLMNLAVLSAFRQGLTSEPRSDCHNGMES